MFTCSATCLRLRNTIKPYVGKLFLGLCVMCASWSIVVLDTLWLSIAFGIAAFVLFVLALICEISLMRSTIKIDPDTLLLIPCASGRDLLVLDETDEWHLGYRSDMTEIPQLVKNKITFCCTTPNEYAITMISLWVRYSIEPRHLTHLDRALLSGSSLAASQLAICVATCFAEALFIKSEQDDSLTYHYHNLHVINRDYGHLDTTIGFSFDPDFTHIRVNLSPLFSLTDFWIYPQGYQSTIVSKADEASIPSDIPIIKLAL